MTVDQSPDSTDDATISTASILDEVHSPEGVPPLYERDRFMRTLIRHLAGAIETVVGLDEAAGLLSIVGQRMGDELNSVYLSALNTSRLSREQLSAVMVDLKRRIRGNFYVAEENDEQIVLIGLKCPFAEKVIGRPSLCMMTSSVLGSIAAENLGYSRVVIDQSIATGHKSCRVVIYLERRAMDTGLQGREYFKGE